MDSDNVGLLIAFAAGILSFVSPCVLPLVPAYIMHLAGATIQQEGNGSARQIAFLQALFFVLGFSVVFVVLGASVGLIGYILRDSVDIFRKTGGLILIILGLHVTGIIKIPFLYQEKRLELNPNRRAGFFTSALVGIVFAVGWSPCIGPILGAIFTLAFDSATAWQGAFLLAAYSLGLGVPFLITALALGSVSKQLRRLNRHMHAVEIASGAFLIAMGVVIFTNLLARISSYFSQLGLGNI